MYSNNYEFHNTTDYVSNYNKIRKRYGLIFIVIGIVFQLYSLIINWFNYSTEIEEISVTEALASNIYSNFTSNIFSFLPLVAAFLIILSGALIIKGVSNIKATLVTGIVINSLCIMRQLFICIVCLSFPNIMLYYSEIYEENTIEEVSSLLQNELFFDKLGASIFDIVLFVSIIVLSALLLCNIRKYFPANQSNIRKTSVVGYILGFVAISLIDSFIVKEIYQSFYESAISQNHDSNTSISLIVLLLIYRIVYIMVIAWSISHICKKKGMSIESQEDNKIPVLGTILMFFSISTIWLYDGIITKILVGSLFNSITSDSVFMSHLISQGTISAFATPIYKVLFIAIIIVSVLSSRSKNKSIISILSGSVLGVSALLVLVTYPLIKWQYDSSVVTDLIVKCFRGEIISTAVFMIALCFWFNAVSKNRTPLWLQITLPLFMGELWYWLKIFVVTVKPEWLYLLKFEFIVLAVVIIVVSLFVKKKSIFVDINHSEEDTVA